MAVELPRGKHLDLHGLVRLAVTIGADGPGVHILRHVAERRNFSDFVEIFLGLNHLRRSLTGGALGCGALARHALVSP